MVGQQLKCTQKIGFKDRFHSKPGRDMQDIYHVYTMYIPCIFQSLDSLGPLCDPLALSFGSIGPVTVLPGVGMPRPGVDLVNMAALQRGRALTICTATLKSVPLSSAVLMWNS